MPIELSVEIAKEVELELQKEQETIIDLEENQQTTFELEPIRNVNFIQHNNYELLDNKPLINSVELQGNTTFEQLGMKSLSNTEIFNLLGGKL